MAAILQISLLGPLTVTIDNHPAEFRTDALRVLLAYLAAHQGTPQRRDTLAGLLSPDRPDKDALTYLRNRLTRLRAALKDDAATPPWLTIDRKQITLRAGDDITIDVTEFEQLLDAMENHAHRQLAGCPTCLARLEEAVALVRGGFLSGLNFPSDTWEAWLLGQREYLQQRSVDAMTLLRNVRLEQGEWEAALSVAQKQLTLEPWHEAAHRAIMQAHVQLGDRNAALAQYEQCQAILWEELAVEPEEETTTLFEQLKADAAEHPKSKIKNQKSEILTNLPLQSTRFFGREAEQTHLLERLVDPNYRLITLIGTGGIGKTRLAIEVGQQAQVNFPDGAWFVPLDAVKGGAEQIKIAVGEAAGLARDDKQLTGDQVGAILRDKQMLLIFDNCETVLDELGFIPIWLNRAPNVVILATSREPLNFQAEAVLLLGGLGIRDTGLGVTHSPNREGLAASRPVPKGRGDWGPAEAMFAEQARMARDGFELTEENLAQVRQICQLVDGLPLGIALAAAWVRRRSLSQIIDAMGQSIDFLSTRMRDVDPRHRSMRAVFETSWQMLDLEEQAILSELSIFPASFTAEAAEQVSGAQFFDLDLLCEKSLLQQPKGERYTMHSLVRQFAAQKMAEQLSPDEQSIITMAFVEHYLEYAREHRESYEQLWPEWYNFSAAISMAHRLEAWQTVLDIVQVLDEPWFRQVRFGEMQGGLMLALEAAKMFEDEAVLIKVMLRLGEVEIENSNYESADAHLAYVLQNATSVEHHLDIAYANYLLGRIKFEQAQIDQAMALCSTARSMFETEEDQLGIAKALNLIALCHMQHADLHTARTHLEASVTTQQHMPPSSVTIEALRYLARIKGTEGEYEAAERSLGEAVNLNRTVQDQSEEVAILFERVILYRQQEQFEKALQFGGECLTHVYNFGSLRWEAAVKMQLAILHRAQGDHRSALPVLRDSLQLYIELGDMHEQAYAHYYLFDLYAKLGEKEESRQSKHQATQLNLILQNPQLQQWLDQSVVQR